MNRMTLVFSKLKLLRKPILISVVYFVFGISWIYVGDIILFQAETNHDALRSFETIKGFVFVSISTLLLLGIQYLFYRKHLFPKADDVLELLSDNKLLNDIMNQLPFALSVSKISSPEKVVMVNSEFQNLLKDSKLEAARMFGNQVQAHQSNLEESQGVFMSEISYINNEQKFITVEVKFIYLKEVDLMLSITKDITQEYEGKQKLKVTESRIKNIANNINGAIFQYAKYPDGSDKFLYMSQGFEGLYEISVEDVKKDVSNIWNLINDETGELKAAIEESEKKLVPWNHVYQISTPTGKIKYLHGRGTPNKTQEGAIVWDTIIMDVTEEQVTKRKLQLYTHRLEKAQELGKMGYWGYDSESRKISWADVTYDIYERDRALGSPSIQEFLQYVDAKSRRLLKQAVTNAIKNGTSYDIQLEINTLSGNKFVRSVGYAEFRGEKVVKLHGISIDISDQKLLEFDLIEQKEYFKTLSNYASDGIVSCDKDGTIQFYNKLFSTWLGENPLPANIAELAQKQFFFSENGSTRLRHEDLPFSKALKDEKVENFRCILVDKSGNQIILEANATALYNSSRKIYGVICVFRNITERVNKEIQINNAFLEGMEKEKQAIASELHDGLAQNLSIVSMNLSNVILDEESLRSNSRFQVALKHLEESMDQSRNIAHTLIPKTLLDFGLTGALEEYVEIYNYSGRFKVELFYNKDKRIDAETELNLFRIVQESVRNIEKHSNAKLCAINIQFGDQDLELSIVDNGVGFNVEQMEGINSGIGLTTIQNRVKKLKGTADIESDKEGTSIIIHIPIT